jgi:hypothetical protein
VVVLLLVDPSVELLDVVDPVGSGRAVLELEDGVEEVDLVEDWVVEVGVGVGVGVAVKTGALEAEAVD